MPDDIPQGWVETEAPASSSAPPEGWTETEAPVIDPNRLVQGWAGNPYAEQQALGYEAARGATMNLVDLAAPKRLTETVNQYSTEHPYAASTARFLGSLAPGVLAPEVLPGFGAEAGIGTRALANMGLGSAEGAAAGAMSEPETPWAGARKGALIGGGAGAVLGAAAGNILAPVKKIVGGADYTSNQAAALIAHKIGQDAEYGSPGAAQIADALDRSAQLGVPSGMMDIGGEQLQGLAGSLYKAPGAPRAAIGNYFKQRDLDASSRLTDAIDSSVATGSKTSDEAIQDLLRQRSQAARPLYEALYNRYPVVSSDYLDKFIQEPIIQQGLASGIKLQRLEALAENRPFDPQAYTLDFNVAGDPVWKGTPNLRTLDAAKRGLDDMLSGDTYRNQYGQLTQMGRSIDNVRRSYVSELDRLTMDFDQNGNPIASPYAQARGAWAGPSRAMEMVNEGGNWTKKDPGQLSRDISNLTPADKDYYLLGVANNMRNRVLGQPGEGNEANRILNTPADRMRAQAMFDPDTYQALVDKVEGERQAFQAYQKIAPKRAGLPPPPPHEGALSTAVLAEVASHNPEIGAPLIALRYGKKLWDWANTPTAGVKAEAARVMTLPPVEQATYLRGVMGRTLPRPTLAPALTPGIAGVFNTAPGEFFRQPPPQKRGGIVGYQ